MQIQTVDLVVINEAAKALKQKQFMFYNNCLFGLDNPGYFSYVDISQNLQNMYYNNYGIIITAKELSTFVKSISTELCFDLSRGVVNTIVKDEPLHIHYDPIVQNDIINKLNNLKTQYNYTEAIDITKELEPVFSLKKNDGTHYFIPVINNNKYFITLFYGLLPLNKNDKIHLQISDTGTNNFISKFTVLKKKFKVNVFIRYLKV